MRIFLPLLLSAIMLAPTAAIASATEQRARKPDLADIAAGSYEGAIVADTRGGSQSPARSSIPSGNSRKD